MICRLCLQTIGNNNCQPVEESLLKSLKLNINISKENVMCIECANHIRVFSTFTPGRAYKEDETLPLSDLDNGVKLDPEPIETTSNPKALTETEIKCSFCTKSHAREDLISLRESKENKFMVDMLEQYILEKNFKDIEELLTCKTCLGSLEGASSVILKCLNVEEKINKYINIEGTDDKGQVELEKVQQFTFKPILKSEIEAFGVNELDDRYDRFQYESIMMTETEIKCEKEIGNMELIIKAEDNITSEQKYGDMPDVKSEQQSDCDGFQEHCIENKSPTEAKTFKCEFCSYQTKRKSQLASHLLTHNSSSEIKMFQCKFCSYQTKWSSCLRTHLFTHQDPSEIKMFQCEFCLYQTKRRSYLTTHLLIHKNPSEIKMFKCEICSYEAKRKCNLRNHLLTHKSPSEIKMFKCELCSFETKRNNHLKTHLLTHKNPSEIKMFKCELCSYEAKQKSHVKEHLLTHKSPTEIQMFKCKLCSYETKRKRQLARHLLTHKNASEINMFKCELCTYEAKEKSQLTRHLLTHKNPSEIKMFKCALCSYMAKCKDSIRRHLLTHKNPSERIMFKCALCSYEAKCKVNLRRHLLIHKCPEIETFQCETCPYETKRKTYLRQHVLTHHESPEKKNVLM